MCSAHMVVEEIEMLKNLQKSSNFQVDVVEIFRTFQVQPCRPKIKTSLKMV